MAKPSVYVVRTTQNPGVAYNVSRAEYERLLELQILAALDLIYAPPDDIVVSTTEPASPAVGLVWFNPSIP